MSKKSFHFYLEKAQGKENIVIEKINEIINFREKIKDNKIIKESFTFLHYPEGSDFNPTTYTSDESTMSGTYVPNLIELKKIIEDQNLYSENNSISFEIEYLDKDSIIKKVFSTEEINKENDNSEYIKSSSSSLTYEKNLEN